MNLTPGMFLMTKRRVHGTPEGCYVVVLSFEEL